MPGGHTRRQRRFYRASLQRIYNPSSGIHTLTGKGHTPSLNNWTRLYLHPKMNHIDGGQGVTGSQRRCAPLDPLEGADIT